MSGAVVYSNGRPPVFVHDWVGAIRVRISEVSEASKRALGYAHDF